MALMAQCEFLLGLHIICIPNTRLSTSNFEGQRTESEIVMTRGKEHFSVCWTFTFLCVGKLLLWYRFLCLDIHSCA